MGEEIQMETYTPYEHAKSIVDCWIFSLYLKYGFEQGKIPSDIFKNKLEFKSVSDKKAVISLKSNHQKTNVYGLSQNLMSYILGDCFLTFDEALDDIFGDKPKEYKNDDIDSLRAIVYMIRCAHAHTPSKPQWRIDRQKYKRLFTIKGIDFKIDFHDLDGKELSENHHNGFLGLWVLIEYTLAIIKKYSDGCATKNE
jgi:hypothetical protein